VKRARPIWEARLDIVGRILIDRAPINVDADLVYAFPGSPVIYSLIQEGVVMSLSHRLAFPRSISRSTIQRSWLVSLLAIALLAMPVLSARIARAHDAPATQPVEPDKFMRFVDDGHGGGSLQTADVGYVNKLGQTVHLIAAIHIAEKSYYAELSKSFEGYDAVLYELVKSKDTPPPGPGDPPSNSGVSEFQRTLKDMLELDFQLDDIDYTKPNFVHADLDRETFERMQAERGESFETLMLKQLIDAIMKPQTPDEQAGEPTPDELISAFTQPDGERRIKVVLAKQMGHMDANAMGLGGPDGSVIVTERNKAAMQVLEDTLAKGDKKIAIFYGAAHMPDMSDRLKALGFQPTGVEWHTAWDLTLRDDQPSLLEKMIDGAVDAIKKDDN
jgi:hypothetical protein